MTTNILILGLNRISVSLCLNMKKSTGLLHRVGYDPDGVKQKSANQTGALDQMASSLTAGVKDADVIIYALPPGQIRDAIQSIRADIKPGSVFVNLNAIGNDTFTELAQWLPEPGSIIVWFPALHPMHAKEPDQGPGSAQMDLFLSSHVYIAGDITTRKAAITVGEDLAILAGALPLHIGPEELAGILALSQDFPRVMAAVITRLITSEPGWSEARKIAGYDFDRISAPLNSFKNEVLPGRQLHANRINLQRLILIMIEELQQMHAALDSDDNPELETLIKNAILGCEIWQKQRAEMSWLEKRPANPDAPHSMTELMFGKRRKKS